MNNIPVCQVELFQYICSEPSSPINCLPGDYGLRLFNAPEIRNQKQVLINLRNFVCITLFRFSRLKE